MEIPIWKVKFKLEWRKCQSLSSWALKRWNVFLFQKHATNTTANKNTLRRVYYVTRSVFLIRA